MLYVLIVEGMSVVVNVMLSLMGVISPHPALCDLSVRTVVKLCTLGVFALGGLGFPNCDDICMCVVIKQFKLLEFVFDSVYVDLQYDYISITFTAGSVSLSCVCSYVVVFGLSVKLWWYPMWMRWMRVLLFVLHVCMPRECEGAIVMAMLVWGIEEVWLW